MNNTAELGDILDACATIEYAELAARGLRSAYGKKVPANINLVPPLVVGWPQRGYFYDEEQGYTMRVNAANANEPRTHHINRFLILSKLAANMAGTAIDETIWSACADWVDPFGDAYLRHVSLGAMCQSARCVDYAYATHMFGGALCFGVDFHVVVLVNRPVTILY